VDTSVVVAILRGDPAAESAAAQAEELFTSDIVLGELYYGAYNSLNPQHNLDQIRRFAESCYVLSTAPAIAHQYGVLKQALRQAGTPIPENDIWIAATALLHRLPLATRDRHFEHIAGLTVLNW
jgi:tRNA(fMet)-specific endonuclease VapC